ncbi:MAG: alpha-galactosidase [Victivallales bacterium]
MIKTENNRYILENKLFIREIAVDKDGVHTVSVTNKMTGHEYVKRPDAAEFQVTLNGDVVYSFNKPEYHVLDGNLVTADVLLAFEGHAITTGADGNEILELRFKCQKHQALIHVFYEIYPDMPGCAKRLQFTGLGDELHVSKLFFEVLNTCPGEFVDAEFFKKQGAVRSQPMFAACGDEDIIQVHNQILNEGLFIGSAVPGPLRYFMVYPVWPSGISCGYGMSGADFNIYLKEGESFTTDRAYLFLYDGAKDDPGIRNRFREMIRRDLPACPDNGGVMYCTWLPFLKNINEALLLDLSDRAAALGFRYFVVDDGWFTDGNWEVDKTKFPNGMEVVSERVRARGMKFGLWFNIGTDYGAVGINPETLALDYHGQPKKFGFGGALTCRCLASSHRDFLVKKLLELVEQYKVDYFKLDLSCIASPYGVTPFGCSATDHAYHRDVSDAVIRQYESMMHVRNEVKKAHSSLVIDFSFETFGTESPSIGALMFSELHHASNMNTTNPKIVDARKIRNALYDFCTLLPAERILGSLICLQNVNDIEHLLTAFIAAPLVAGDLRKITEEDCTAISAITSSLNSLTAHGPLTEFYKLRGDMYIARQDWDGFVRYSRDGRGMVCLFKNKSLEPHEILTIPLLPKAVYRFVDAISKKELGKWTAEELHEGIETEWLKDGHCRTVVFSTSSN